VASWNSISSAICATSPTSTCWQEFLEQETTRSNEQALVALRGQRQDRLGVQLLSVADLGEARQILLPHLYPQVCRDGRVIYRVDDCGLVLDEAQPTRVVVVAGEYAVQDVLTLASV
jgi:hypothetical protein